MWETKRFCSLLLLSLLLWEPKIHSGNCDTKLNRHENDVTRSERPFCLVHACVLMSFSLAILLLRSTCWCICSFAQAFTKMLYRQRISRVNVCFSSFGLVLYGLEWFCAGKNSDHAFFCMWRRMENQNAPANEMHKFFKMASLHTVLSYICVPSFSLCSYMFVVGLLLSSLVLCFVRNFFFFACFFFG